MESSGSRWQGRPSGMRHWSRAESREGVPTWPFHGRAFRCEEQQVRGLRQECARAGGAAPRPEWPEHCKQGGPEVRGLLRATRSLVRNLTFTSHERGRQCRTLSQEKCELIEVYRITLPSLWKRSHLIP